LSQQGEEGMAKESIASFLPQFVGEELFFHEKNLKEKSIDLVSIIIAMFFLYLGAN
jgi:hypothetical protein